MRPILILQLRPEDEVADSEFAAILRYARLAPDEVVRVRVDRDGVPDVADLDDYAAVIVGGSPFETTTPESEKSDVQRRIEVGFRPFLTAVIERDAPFLGCCSGHGLLGAVCDTPMSGRYAEPVSAATVSLTGEGRDDPLFDGFPDDFRVFLGHKEACDEVPRGGVLLVRGERCPIQMFRIGENVYSTQFHPEGDAEGFSLRIRYYRNHGYFPAEAADDYERALKSEEAPWSQELLRRFVSRYRDVDASP